MTTAARAGRPSQSLLSGLSVAGNASAAQKPITSTATTNRNGTLSAPIPLRPRAAPRIMIAPSEIGTPNARSHGAQTGVPPCLNAAAYPIAIATIATQRAERATVRVMSPRVVVRDGSIVSDINGSIGLARATGPSRAGFRPGIPRRRGTGLLRDE